MAFVSETVMENELNNGRKHSADRGENSSPIMSSDFSCFAAFKPSRGSNRSKIGNFLGTRGSCVCGLK